MLARRWCTDAVTNNMLSISLRNSKLCNTSSDVFVDLFCINILSLGTPIFIK